ncbi:uncharacterized protein LOC110027935 [Phalaenopsis equestris]|uniref:uncharacterized protein LOC110027935 n=1 Tax=Phalaenopsis equestris TaxID=78828 RepID=UPI0009E2B254|nr:uncharacterized protein LOC110027935 [Phalaenopsis equestris]
MHFMKIFIFQRLASLGSFGSFDSKSMYGMLFMIHFKMVLQLFMEIRFMRLVVCTVTLPVRELVQEGPVQHPPTAGLAGCFHEEDSSGGLLRQNKERSRVLR